MAPGDLPDILARLMGQFLAKRFGQPFIKDNRQGVATIVGTEAAARASADGNTLPADPGIRECLAQLGWRSSQVLPLTLPS